MPSRNGLSNASPLVDIAPAPSKNSSPENGTFTQQHMPYTCQTCTRRKVRCDKAIPVCTTCRKSKLECLYQAPPPRRKKRKLSDDVNDRLRRYEQILQDNGLLKDAVQTPADEYQREQPRGVTNDSPFVSDRLNEPETARVGKLLSSSGKSRYIDSNLWRTIGDDDMNQLSDEEEDDTFGDPGTGRYISDPLSGALVGGHVALISYHPSYEIALQLWRLYVTNVDPICRVLHTPSTEPIFEQAAREPSQLSRSTECLLFAVYHFAVVSMPEAECLRIMQEPQSQVVARLRHATCQALVNAAFLRSSEMPILQALLLYLLSVRNHYDPHTFWILSGVAWRIGLRMGLHRDGEFLGLPPFEVQMRRRLFWQLLPMDGIAAQISGTGIVPAPDSWDTKQPLNLNESQIWPGMTHQPEPQEGATDMIFCLARTEIGKFHTRTAIKQRDKVDTRPADLNAETKELEDKIARMEDMLERKIVRYCDISEPLHFLTITFCRGAMVVIRLRLKIAASKHHPMSMDHLREVHRLAMKVVDYDITAYQNPGLQRYLWHFRALFMHSAVACALSALRTPSFLTPDEIRTAWQKYGQLMANHQDILDNKRALHIAIGRLTLKAWDASAHVAGLNEEPDYIVTLRQLRRGGSTKKMNNKARSDETAIAASLANDASPDSTGMLNGLAPGDFSLNSDECSLETMDWLYWDQLMQDFQGKPFSVS